MEIRDTSPAYIAMQEIFSKASGDRGSVSVAEPEYEVYGE